MSVYKDENYTRAVIAETDSVLGIAEEDAPKQFTLLHRIHYPDTAGIRGTDFGSYTFKSPVEMMGGQIWVKIQVIVAAHSIQALPQAEES